MKKFALISWAIISTIISTTIGCYALRVTSMLMDHERDVRKWAVDGDDIAGDVTEGFANIRR